MTVIQIIHIIFPKFSSIEESESESAYESDNESNISIPGPSRRQMDVTPTTGFS